MNNQTPDRQDAPDRTPRLDPGGARAAPDEKVSCSARCTRCRARPAWGARNTSPSTPRRSSRCFWDPSAAAVLGQYPADYPGHCDDGGHLRIAADSQQGRHGNRQAAGHSGDGAGLLLSAVGGRAVAQFVARHRGTRQIVVPIDEFGQAIKTSTSMRLGLFVQRPFSPADNPDNFVAYWALARAPGIGGTFRECDRPAFWR